MQFATRITRAPRAFDPEQGESARALAPDAPTEVGDVLAGVGGSSPYLLGLMQKEADWLPVLLSDGPEAALDREIAGLVAEDPRATSSGLRRTKRRVALGVALADLAGVWRLEEVTGTLTRFADAAVQTALMASLRPLVERGKLPGMGPDALDTACGMTVLAMGKMGAFELNYSSDIDLICLFDQDRYAPDDFHDARSTLVKATRAMSKMLSDVTGEGYVLRTDLRLRPDPAVTPVCLAMEAAEHYYESLGRTWERAAYIKARPCAGDLDAGAAFLNTLTPFVWRKHLDFAAIEDAHNMRLAIREHKGTGGPITLPGHNMKLGRGGIREIEFYTQTRQLIAGGRDRSLRVRGTCEGLDVLADAGWVEEATATALKDHYAFHRTVEHRLQMVQDAQTHNLPNSPEGFDRLACLMDRDVTGLQDEIMQRLGDVHARTEGFFAPDPEQSDVAADLLTPERLTRWLTYPALRHARARSLLDRLRPVFEDHLRKAARPAEALSALDGFLAGLPGGVQLFSLFNANPQLVELVLDVVSTSPALGAHLSRNAGVLDAVIGGDFFSDWPGQAALTKDLAAAVAEAESDYEAALDTARRWMKEWHFRIGVHVLRGLSGAEEASRQYAELARAVLDVIWPRVQTEFARKHGPPPGRGAVLLGMGALGAGHMNAGSDLDLIVIFDAAGVDQSDGPRPLAARPYFARLTQMLITALSAPMSEGRLYEVDMRLRPSGNQGPVATSWPGFRDYQTSDAWTWEHLALTRAAVVAGPADLAADVEAFRREVLARPRDLAGLSSDVADMRARIAAAKPPASWLDIKAGPGSLQDIELLSQTGALRAGGAGRSVAEGLAALSSMGYLDRAQEELLARHYGLYWEVQLGARLLVTGVADPDALGQSGQALLLRLAGSASLAELEETLAQAKAAADTVIVAALGAMQSEAGT